MDFGFFVYLFYGYRLDALVISARRSPVVVGGKARTAGKSFVYYGRIGTERGIYYRRFRPEEDYRLYIYERGKTYGAGIMAYKKRRDPEKLQKLPGVCFAYNVYNPLPVENIFYYLRFRT